MGIFHCLHLQKPTFLQTYQQFHPFNFNTTPYSKIQPSGAKRSNLSSKEPIFTRSQHSKFISILMAAAGMALVSIAGPSLAAESPTIVEPSNALSLPTWAVHVSSVIEWATAMALVWQYGEKSGYESWKSLSWGMVPLLGGALCACTWHFFYNSESLEILVGLQAALTVIGNATMCIAAYRIYISSEERSKDF